MTLTLEQAKQVKYGQILYSMIHFNKQGQPARWKVNGQVKTWKRDFNRVKIPVKHGLYAYDYVTEDILHLVTLDEDEARAANPAIKKDNP